ncbi:MAG TPA: urease accessory UreF family protein [Gemmatimonadales bacterium]|nr:urease accessory UreF family protein [Gemmatimonadales bacterium]
MALNPTADWLAWQVVDSAFPTGVFAHSWGLEAAWQQGEVEDLAALRRFLHASIQQTAYGALPLLTAAYRRPERWLALDELADAFLTNSIANRASRVQGRTLLSTARRVWPSDAMTELASSADRGCAHVAPLSGVVFRLIGLPLETARTAMLFGTARGVLSAAVRLGIAGSYHAQRMHHEAGRELAQLLERSAALDADDVCQTAPVLDMLQSAHDRLYSRLFQS